MAGFVYRRRQYLEMEEKRIKGLCNQMKKGSCFLVGLGLFQGILGDNIHADFPQCNERRVIDSSECTIDSIGAEQIEAYAFNKCGLPFVAISPEVKRIGEYAFLDSYNLKYITLHVKLAEIGEGAFMCCSALEKINLPLGIKTISPSLFTGCSSLIDAKIPQTVTNIGEAAFSKCYSLSQILIPSNVLTIGRSAFSKCRNLKSLVFEQGVSEIGEAAFAECVKLERVVLPSSIKFIGKYAFYGCTNLKRIEFLGKPPQTPPMPSILLETPRDLEVFVHGQSRWWEEDLGEWPKDRENGRRKLVILP